MTSPSYDLWKRFWKFRRMLVGSTGLLAVLWRIDGYREKSRYVTFAMRGKPAPRVPCFPARKGDFQYRYIINTARTRNCYAEISGFTSHLGLGFQSRHIIRYQNPSGLKGSDLMLYAQLERWDFSWKASMQASGTKPGVTEVPANPDQETHSASCKLCCRTNDHSNPLAQKAFETVRHRRLSARCTKGKRIC